MSNEKCLVMDNGSFTIKCGWRTDKSPELVPNWIMRPKDRRKTYVGRQMEQCKELSNIHITTPFQKGYLFNWAAQKSIWDTVFSDVITVHDPSETHLVVTEPPFNFRSIQEAWDEAMFEEYRFKSVFRCSAPTLTAFHYKQTHRDNLCCLVVDSGHTFTHIVPYYCGQRVTEGTKRINVGGKHLANLLKELISYRQLNLMEESYVCNLIKEDVCFVSTSFDEEMALSRQKDPSVLCDYVLPDFVNIHRGYVKMPDTMELEGDDQEEKRPEPTKEQTIRLSLERFSVPEILFHPSDIGIDEMGISEAIVEAINQCPASMRPHLYNNIVVTGGSSKFQNFKERVLRDVRANAPDEFSVNVYRPEDPVMEAWRGGSVLGGWAGLPGMRVTKAQYDEIGPNICHTRFTDSIPISM